MVEGQDSGGTLYDLAVPQLIKDYMESDGTDEDDHITRDAIVVAGLYSVQALTCLVCVLARFINYKDVGLYSL